MESFRIVIQLNPFGECICIISHLLAETRLNLWGIAMTWYNIFSMIFSNQSSCNKFNLTCHIVNGTDAQLFAMHFIYSYFISSMNNRSFVDMKFIEFIDKFFSFDMECFT